MSQDTIKLVRVSVDALRCSSPAKEVIRALHGASVTLPAFRYGRFALAAFVELAVMAAALLAASGWAATALILGCLWRGLGAFVGSFVPIGLACADDKDVAEDDDWLPLLRSHPVVNTIGRTMGLGWAGIAAHGNHPVVAVLFILAALWGWAVSALSRRVLEGALKRHGKILEARR